mmetsp:Transcript_32498/g.103215  ORF Transcript_32498/g.103215 Transcript_32498/m.103215 type:complete len:332 (-) Transcript_32498:120-1115(-)
MASMSDSLRPPLERMTMFCSLPVALSLALTFMMPSASMSKATSILGWPLRLGGMPTRSNWPSSLLSVAILRSPWSTLICTWLWLSAAVVNSWVCFVGMVVLRGMSTVMMPPSVSMPSDSGFTSSSTMSRTSPRSTPPWMAAPMATTSSGFTPRFGFFAKNSSTLSCTMGMRVWPPTSSTSSTSPLSSLASRRQSRHGWIVRSTRSFTSASNLALVILMFRCFGPLASAVMNGRFTSVWPSPSSSRFAFSEASRRRCIASMSLLRSMPDSALNSAMRWRSSASSKSSPPSSVSPLVDFTSKTPPLISRMDTSNVPPPRSKTTTTLPSASFMP